MLQQQFVIDKVCKQLAKELNEDPEIVHQIVVFQFSQIVEQMKDLNNTKDILLNQLFKFKLKTRYKNNKSLKYCTHD